jgi:hypothetical protein
VHREIRSSGRAPRKIHREVPEIGEDMEEDSQGDPEIKENLTLLVKART